MLSVGNQQVTDVASVHANKNKNRAIYLYDRYGDLGWSRTDKQ